MRDFMGIAMMYNLTDRAILTYPPRLDRSKALGVKIIEAPFLFHFIPDWQPLFYNHPSFSLN